MAESSDINEQLLEMLRCMICRDEKVEQKMLPCQHSACESCLERMAGDKQTIKCPECQKESTLPSGGIAVLDDHLILKQLACFVKIDTTGDDSGQAMSEEDERRVEEIKKAEAASEQKRRAAKQTLQKFSVMIGEIEEGSATAIRNLEEMASKCQEKSREIAEAKIEQVSRLRPQLEACKEELRRVDSAQKTAASVRSKLCQGESLTDEETENLTNCLGTIHAPLDSRTFANPRVLSSGCSVQLAAGYNSDQAKKIIKNPVPYSSVGIVQNQGKTLEPGENGLLTSKEVVWVCFPEKPNWIGKLDDLIPTRGMSHAVSANKRVRVKSSVVKPKKGWNQINRESVGVVREVTWDGDVKDMKVAVDFPENHSWEGFYQELECIPGHGFKVGDSVRVNPHLPAPSQGWGKLNGSSVGEISHLADSSGVDTEVSVCFEDDVEWTGIVGDLELVKKLYTGDYVQFKLSVTEPHYGWEGMKHTDVCMITGISNSPPEGDVADILSVDESSKKGKCLLSELELPRYTGENCIWSRNTSRTLELNFGNMHETLMRNLSGLMP